MSLFESNLAVLKDRYPPLAERLQAMPDKECIRIFKAKDGSVAYGIRQNGHIQPITDPVAPLAKIQTQLDQWSNQLADHTRPILVVGLYPGNELLCLFDRVEEYQTPHCPQPIWVCVDSTYCLHGFLSSWDARRVLESPRVRFFWHDQMPAQVQWLREHPEFPHLFTLISGAGDRTLNQIMPPLAELIEQRDAETKKLMAENEAYYDAISDETLAEIIGNAECRMQNATQVNLQPTANSLSRKPRLLMPTVTWSTYIQHSTRDTCAAFEDMGWETLVLKMNAMLTPYHLVKAINEFKPDVFLFIDHMRHEAAEVYPRNMMFVTWIQDEMPNLQCKKAGEKLAEYAAHGKRDLVVGYVNGLDTKYGFPKDRLISLNIPADPRIFHPVELTEEDWTKYGCDLAFMTNTSMSSEQVIEQKILPEVEPMGISRATCMRIHDDLWKLYRAGDILTDRAKFLEWLMQYPEFAAAWNAECRMQNAELSNPTAHSPGRSAPAEPGSLQPTASSSSRQDELLRLFYWRLNDTIYRHVVLEWADELAEQKPDARRRTPDTGAPCTALTEKGGPLALRSRGEEGMTGDSLPTVAPWAKAGRQTTNAPEPETTFTSHSFACFAGNSSSPNTEHRLVRRSFSEGGTLNTQPKAFRLHLYGLGWENHPRFRKYACGPLAHGPELNKAYQAARHCLHLNIAEGMHQRMYEIMASGGNLLIRTSRPITPVAGEPPRALMRRLASALRMHGNDPLGKDQFDPFRADLYRTPEEKDALSDWVFNIAFYLAKQDAAKKGETPAKPLESRVMERIQSALNSRLDWNLDDWEEYCFNDRDLFIEKVMA